MLTIQFKLKRNQGTCRFTIEGETKQTKDATPAINNLVTQLQLASFKGGNFPKNLTDPKYAIFKHSYDALQL